MTDANNDENRRICEAIEAYTKQHLTITTDDMRYEGYKQLVKKLEDGIEKVAWLIAEYHQTKNLVKRWFIRGECKYHHEQNRSTIIQIERWNKS